MILHSADPATGSVSESTLDAPRIAFDLRFLVFNTNPDWVVSASVSGSPIVSHHGRRVSKSLSAMTRFDTDRFESCAATFDRFLAHDRFRGSSHGRLGSTFCQDDPGRDTSKVVGDGRCRCKRSTSYFYEWIFPVERGFVADHSFGKIKRYRGSWHPSNGETTRSSEIRFVICVFHGPLMP